ncbi:phosphatidylserine/phosphatidylglycerophosphate/cardiolipin synthase family protein [Roseovarius sp. M141]|uniref:phospholipase D-like domain-containing protein n=1 Tax=Roseovarius sp. M141 TaxID=2583806 RepID=UPI0020CFBAE9|nr:phospholipase D family protein [Roseovarius sp. M141]MCQ0091245.1 phospholipase D family protein [Roseovarius sp. M141]
MKRFMEFLIAIIVIAAIAVVVARLVFPLPDISQREASTAIPAEPETPLGQMMAAGADRHPGTSGVIPLRDGHDALASRLDLVTLAEQSIDAQYYIWHDDVSGILLLDALRDAAQRGVRVRLLLDDNGVPGLDPFLAALNAQDNFEIRLFNPSTVRSPKLAGYAFDFPRMNRRMHNKSLIADGAAAIIGGRNIGDEYFQVGNGVFYVDMDVLATGKVVAQTAAVFDDYWNSVSVFSVESIIDGIGDLAAFEARVAEIAASPEAKAFLGDANNSAARYAKGAAQIEWTDVQLVADDPAKGQGIATTDQLMITQLGGILGKVTRRLDLVSAYFVPGEEGVAYFSNLARSGIDVRILTNALNTTDVLMVHAGYSKYRRALLEAGVKLYELKLRGDMTQEADLQIKPLGLSGASLHAKTFAIDDSRIFIGSFNFDPRSAMLNCEMGFLIDSPTLAKRVSEGFSGPLAEVSYQPELTPENKMVWKEPLSDRKILIYQEEPGATWFEQIAIVVIGFLPVEWLL